MPANLRSSQSGLLDRERRHPIRPLGGHRLEGVGHVEDPGELRDLVADQAVRIARAVVPLVVVANDRQLRGELRDRRDDLGAEHRMGVHHHPLVARQPVLLLEDAVGHADLADVVEEAAPLEGLELRLRDVHLLADVDGDRLHPMAVLAGERIPLVDGPGQRPDGLGEHLAHLDESVVGDARRVERKSNSSVAHQVQPSR